MVNTRVTQVPILVIDGSNQPARVTQVPLLIVTREAQPMRVTQAPVLASITPKPIPEPLPVVPDTAVREVWEWLTAVNIKERGGEQRAALRSMPRVAVSFGTALLKNQHWREAYDIIHRFIDREFIYPSYQYSAILSQSSPVGTDQLYFDRSATDIRANETVALYDPYLEKTTFVEIGGLNADGASAAEPLQENLRAGLMICPAIIWRLGNSSIDMDSVSGVVQLSMESFNSRVFQRPGSTASLLMLDGLPVLDRRPKSASNFQFDKGVEWLDNEVGIPEPHTRWKNTYIGGKVVFHIVRPLDMDYWRLFADTVQGRLKPFIVPTWRDDLPLASTPALGATQFVTTNVQFARYRPNKAYSYVQIHSANGVKYRKVLDSVTNYDANGDPESVTVMLASSIGNVAGDNVISGISYANLCRMGGDSITLTHYELDTDLEFSIRTVDR